jgi:hypothetical protein
MNKQFEDVPFEEDEEYSEEQYEEGPPERSEEYRDD